MVILAIIISLLLLGSLLLYYLFYPAIVAYTSPIDSAVKQELLAPSSKSKKGPIVVLSLVIPAYNEQDRLSVMFDATLRYLKDNRQEVIRQCLECNKSNSNNDLKNRNDNENCILEWIVVNDGSTDKTCQVVRDYCASQIQSLFPNDLVQLVSLAKNSGKGAAVRAGMLRSSGDLCLMVDADGATDFGPGLQAVLSQYAILAQTSSSSSSAAKTTSSTVDGDDGGAKAGSHISKKENNRNPSSLSSMQRQKQATPPTNNNMICVFGSRAHLKKNSAAERSKLRTFLMHAFHFFVFCITFTSIKDTQCGFKLFSRPACVRLFTLLHLKRWAFDIELVVLSQMLRLHGENMQIAEVAVPWKEVDGSKLDAGGKLTLALVSLGMLRDMICVRACYSLGLWKLKR